MKNIDDIKAMKAWDLAKFIYEVSNNSTKITNCNNICAECEYSDSYCISGIAEWLEGQKNDR